MPETTVTVMVTEIQTGLNGGLNKDKMPETTTVTVTEIPTLLNGGLNKDKMPEMTTVTVTVTGHNGGPTDKIPEMDRTVERTMEDGNLNGPRLKMEKQLLEASQALVKAARKMEMDKPRSKLRMAAVAVPQDARARVADGSTFKMVHLALPVTTAVAPNSEAAAQVPMVEAEAQAPMEEVVALNSEAEAQAAPLEETEIAIHGADPASPETPSLETHKCSKLLKSDRNELYQ